MHLPDIVEYLEEQDTASIAHGDIYHEELCQVVIELKRKAKKSWDHFGISEALVNKITELSNKN